MSNVDMRRDYENKSRFMVCMHVYGSKTFLSTRLTMQMSFDSRFYFFFFLFCFVSNGAVLKYFIQSLQCTQNKENREVNNGQMIANTKAIKLEKFFFFFQTSEISPGPAWVDKIFCSIRTYTHVIIYVLYTSSYIFHVQM